MRTVFIGCLAAALATAFAGVRSVGAAEVAATPAVPAAESKRQHGEEGAAPLAPYDFLIGEWDVKAKEDGPTAAIIRAKWGPNRSYIWYASTLMFGAQSIPHLEGMLVWNAVHKNLDMLFCMDLKTGRVQEQGTMSVAADGAIVRDITAIYGPGARAIGMPPVGAEGATAHFRETYTRSGGDKIATSAMRESDQGWVPTFPGSDHLIMVRRAEGGDPVAGSWDVTFQVAGAVVPGKFNLQVAEHRVTGTAVSEHTGPGTVSDGLWADNKLTMTLKFAAHESIAITGTAENGKLQGELRTEGRTGTWSATRN